MTTVDLTAEQLEALDAALDKAAGQSGCYRHVIAAVELIATEHRASERGVIAERLRLSAVDRFDEYGPHDDRGAAFWDAACWLNEGLSAETVSSEGQCLPSPECPCACHGSLLGAAHVVPCCDRSGQPLAPVEFAVSRCSRCRHAPHDTLGFCPNMASDNDCDCPGAQS